MSDLASKSCKPCEGKTPALNKKQIYQLLKKVDGWKYSRGAIERTLTFKNYYQTVSFVNAVAWIAHTEDHHPDITFGYKECRIRYNTHAVDGMSENDFICAAKINRLL